MSKKVNFGKYRVYFKERFIFWIMPYLIVKEPMSKGVTCTTLANSLKKQYYCEKCKSGFSKLSYLRLHMKLHAFVCSLCSRRYFYKSLLRRHLRLEHKFINLKYMEEKFKCAKCSKIFLTKREYKYHQWIHYLDKFICIKMKNNKENYLRTKLYEDDDHRQNRELKLCGVCGKKVKHIRSHIMLVHRPKCYLCRICDKYFCFRTDFWKHMLIHLKTKYTCSVCGKSFTQKCHLIFHNRIHTGGKLFKCKICHVSFIRSYALTLHEKTVHGTKEARKFSCDRCPFTAITRRCVNYHKNLFHLERFQCEKCCRVFTNQKWLKIHSWTHSDQKSFSCSHCSQQYATKAGLTKHLKRVCKMKKEG